MLNVFFAGTPECAVPALRAIAEKHNIVGVLTNPPSAVGRAKTLVPSPVALAVQTLKQQEILSPDTPICTPEKLNEPFRNSVSVLRPDIMVCFAFGKIFGPKTLSLFPKRALNIHPSLLPRWRGPSPVPAAIAAGDTITGITIQYMAAQMDCGDIILQEQVPIMPIDTTESLLARCAQLSSSLILQALDAIEHNTVHCITQDDTAATYCKLIQKEDGLICWAHTAADIDRKIRAYTPWPGAFTHWRGTKLLIKQAHPYQGQQNDMLNKVGCAIGIDPKQGILIQTGKGILAVTMLQRQTKKVMHWKDFLNGAAGFIGEFME